MLMNLRLQALVAGALAGALAFSSPASANRGLWITDAELAALPTSGAAWDNVKEAADEPTGTPNLSNQDDPVNVRVLAKALVYARTGVESYRTQVIDACMKAIGTEGGRTLALGRELAAYPIAADLVGMPADKDTVFRAFLRRMQSIELEGKTLESTHEVRPNNWGTAAGASRLAVALYLGDNAEVQRVAQVFKGWLGDRTSYAGFTYGELDWQADPGKPVAINPKGSVKLGHSIDGVLPEELRRSGAFTWPPPKENYVYTALDGALAQAILLRHAGYDVWNWQDKALLRAYQWLHQQANFPAVGNDTWQPHVINRIYGSSFPAPSKASPGKIVGWTDWTYSVGGADGCPKCSDGVQNCGESDRDCGRFCTKCALDKRCEAAADCASGNCVNGICAASAAASCTDDVRNQDETDVDCGGATCPKCPDGDRCSLGRDCSSGTCSAGTCVTPSQGTCSDAIRNQNETDIDCGGSCPQCPNGKKCLASTDCASSICERNVCSALPTPVLLDVEPVPSVGTPP
jgi:hypothetical protein